MYTVILDYNFIASHAVRMPDGVFEPTHSHQWHLSAAFSAETLDDNGFLLEFSEGQTLICSAVAEISGKDINKCGVLAGKIPTTEVLAKYIYGNIKKGLQSPVQINYIELTESPGCTVRYTE